MMMMLIWLLLTLVLPFKEVLAQCSLVNLTASNLTFTAIIVQWETQGPCFINEYTVQATHTGYKACPHLTGLGLQKPIQQGMFFSLKI